MRAIQFTGPKQIRMLTDAPIPEPEAGEVQVRSTFVGMCGSNMGHYTGEGLYAKIYPVPVGKGA